MILSDNKDDDWFIDDNLIENLLKSNKNQSTELEIKAKEIPKQKDISLNRCLGQHMN